MTDDSLTSAEREELETALRIARDVIRNEKTIARLKKGKVPPISLVGPERNRERLRRLADVHPLVRVILPEVRRIKREEEQRLEAIDPSGLDYVLAQLDNMYNSREDDGIDPDLVGIRTIENILEALDERLDSSSLCLVKYLLAEIRFGLMEVKHIPDVSPIQYTVQQVRDNMPSAGN